MKMQNSTYVCMYVCVCVSVHACVRGCLGVRKIVTSFTATNYASEEQKLNGMKLCYKLLKRIGFTFLYFKMAVKPLVPETKMVDVGKLISFGNLLARKVK